MNDFDDPLIKLYLSAVSVSKKLNDIVRNELNRELKNTGLRYQHWFILKMVYFDQATTPAHIADTLGINRAAVTRLVDDLVVRSLVVHDRSSDDRRLVNLAVTEQGIQIAIKGINVIKKIPALFKQNLTTYEYDFVSLIETHFTSSQL